jgi:hypothetical protein
MIFQAHRIRWFEPVQDDRDENQLEILVKRHLESLSMAGERRESPLDPEVLLLEGDWTKVAGELTLTTRGVIVGKQQMMLSVGSCIP